jgi:REP element-mobilizing transposase RayT
MPPQCLDPARTTWHVTFGTYGTRLHGGDRPTVERRHNRLGEPFIEPDPGRPGRVRGRMRHPPVVLDDAQRRCIEASVPDLCVRGGWSYRIAAAGPDHVHVLLDVPPRIHGEAARRLLKRWLSEALNDLWRHDGRWWAAAGSNKAIRDERYLNAAYRYVLRQRASGTPR